MYEEQPVFPPALMVRLPQLPPQQVATKRQKYAKPVLTRYTVQSIPVTPRPGFLPYPPFETRLPDTPPIASLSIPSSQIHSPMNTTHSVSPGMLYIPRTTRRRELGIGESLVGCALLLLIATVVLVLLYYLSSAG